MNLKKFRGWSVEYNDGTIIYEGQAHWNAIPKVGIKTLCLHYDQRQWYIHDKNAYLQKKRGSMPPFVPQGDFRIESRSIGYYDGNNKVWYTVNENTGKMKMEVEDTNA